MNVLKKTLDMKKTIFLFSLLMGFLAVQAQDCTLKSDGAYIFSAEDSDLDREFNQFIRFLDNNEVISASSVYDIVQSANWFHKNDPAVAEGSYVLEGCNLEFTTRGTTGKFYFIGTLENDVLKLKVLEPGKKKKEMINLDFVYREILLK